MGGRVCYSVRYGGKIGEGEGEREEEQREDDVDTRCLFFPFDLEKKGSILLFSYFSVKSDGEPWFFPFEFISFVFFIPRKTPPRPFPFFLSLLLLPFGPCTYECIFVSTTVYLESSGMTRIWELPSTYLGTCF